MIRKSRRILVFLTILTVLFSALPLSTSALSKGETEERYSYGDSIVPYQVTVYWDRASNFRTYTLMNYLAYGKDADTDKLTTTMEVAICRYQNYTSLASKTISVTVRGSSETGSYVLDGLNFKSLKKSGGSYDFGTVRLSADSFYVKENVEIYTPFLYHIRVEGTGATRGWARARINK